MNANELINKLKLVRCLAGDGQVLNEAEAMIRQQQAEIEALKANREHDFGLGEASGFIKGHQANPYKAITNTKIEPTVVSYTHPVKEHFENEPQAEELHEILQSNNHPVKELFKDAENRDELIGQEFETYLEKLTQDFKEGFKEGVLFCEDVARRPALYGQDTHSVKELTDEEILYFYKPCFYHAEDFVSEIREILRKVQE